MPIIEEFERLHEEKEDRWSWHPRQLELLDGAKEKAKASGLWNFFLPDSEIGEGLTNLDYAPLCEEMGRVGFAAEVFNCSAPDTGNMETIERYGSPEQKKQWLVPLLEGSRPASRLSQVGKVSRGRLTSESLVKNWSG